MKCTLGVQNIKNTFLILSCTPRCVRLAVCPLGGGPFLIHTNQIKIVLVTYTWSADVIGHIHMVSRCYWSHTHG